MHMRNFLLKSVTAACFVAFATSCTTTYDAYGRPQQSVDPALAVAGIAAAGLVGYAIAENNNDNNNTYYRHPPPRYYHAPAPRRPYYRPYCPPPSHHYRHYR